MRPLVGLVTLVLAACAPAVSFPTSSLPLPPTAASVETFRPAPTATPRVRLHSPDARTGIPDLDAVIAVILGNDVPSRRNLVQYTITRCTTRPGLGGPPKCEGREVEGTRVRVLPILGSEGGYIRPDLTPEAVDRVLQFTVRGLYAAFRVSKSVPQEEYWPAGQYGTLFQRDDGSWVNVLTDRGGIVRLHFLMGETPTSLLAREAEELILPPPLSSRGAEGAPSSFSQPLRADNAARLARVAAVATVSR